MPLGFVILVSMIKDIFEDLKRHRSDNTENNMKVLIGDENDGEFKHNFWKFVQVGQILKINQDEYFPCDMILLGSSANKGLCYVETKNLDGETNLKHKQSMKETMTLCKSES